MTQPSELRGAILGRGYQLGQAAGLGDEALHEASHERIPGRFLLRMFPLEALSKPQGAVRIHRAIRVASLLRDPHVVQILDFSATGEAAPFVVLEPVDAETLQVALARVGILALPRVVELVESIAVALRAGHRIGLVHGDLRPDLILLPSAGSPPARVSGFGWSKELRYAAIEPAPSLYLAPEQHPNSTFVVDERADQFSLGAIAYQMLSGRLPFEENDFAAPSISSSNTHPIPEPLAGTVEGIPGAIDEVLGRALAFQPARRFKGVRELASQLRIASLGLPEPLRPAVSATAADASPSPTPTPIDEPPIRFTADRAPTAVTAPPGPDSRDAQDQLLDDEGLVLGSFTAPVVDDVKTQISRSPFFEREVQGSTEPSNEDGSEDGHREEPEPDVEPVAEPTRKSSDALSDTNWALDPARPYAGRPRRPQSPPMGTPRLTPRVAAGVAARSTVEGSPPEGASGSAKPFAPRVGSVATIVAALSILSLGTWLLVRQRDVPVADRAKTEAAATRTAPSATAIAVPVPVTHPVIVPAAAIEPLMEGPQPAPAPAGALSPPTNAVAAAAAAASPAAPTAKPGRAPGAAALPNAAATAISAGCLVRIASTPQAEVWLDDRNTGKRTPLDGFRVSCGTHKLVLKRPEQDIEQMEMIEVKRGQPFRRAYELE